MSLFKHPICLVFVSHLSLVSLLVKDTEYSRAAKRSYGTFIVSAWLLLDPFCPDEYLHLKKKNLTTLLRCDLHATKFIYLSVEVSGF